jgi:hypothetical protein
MTSKETTSTKVNAIKMSEQKQAVKPIGTEIGMAIKGRSALIWLVICLFVSCVGLWMCYLIASSGVFFLYLLGWPLITLIVFLSNKKRIALWYKLRNTPEYRAERIAMRLVKQEKKQKRRLSTTPAYEGGSNTIPKSEKIELIRHPSTPNTDAVRNIALLDDLE